MKKLLFILLLLLNANLAFGYYTENIIGGCDNQTLVPDNNISNLLPVFTPNNYTCDVGEFLPAYTLGCRACPSGYNCSGGTFNFNPTQAQGITQKDILTQNANNICSVNLLSSDNNNVSNLLPRFTPNQHNCAPGYYLPANMDGCVICPANSYCVGGTYTFNETVAQGITQCGAGLYAPAGMWESSQCGRILHIGDEVVYLRATKKTTPSLNIDIDSDGVADYFGNMTTLDVPMTRGTQRKLKISYGGQTYSVYDDSVDLTQYQN